MADALRAERPEVRALSHEVRLRLREKLRNRPDPRGQPGGGAFGRERKRVRPQVDPAGRERTLARRLVALVGVERDVEGGVARPRLQDAVVEVEAVHFRAHDVVIDLSADGPAARIDRGQATLPVDELPVLRGHGGRAVVRHAVDELRLLEGSPSGKQRDQVFVTDAPGRSARSVADVRSGERGGEQTGGRHGAKWEKHLRILNPTSSCPAGDLVKCSEA